MRQHTSRLISSAKAAGMIAALPLFAYLIYTASPFRVDVTAELLPYNALQGCFINGLGDDHVEGLAKHSQDLINLDQGSVGYPLELAAMAGRDEAVKILLKQGADLELAASALKAKGFTTAERRLRDLAKDVVAD